MKNSTKITPADNIEFNGKTYPVRQVYIRDYGYSTIGTESLSRELFDANDRYVSDEAQNIDESIFFFVEDKYMNCGDQQLADVVERALA